MRGDEKYLAQGWLIVAILVVLWCVVFALSSCSATKDRKAIVRVISSPELVARVAKILPPCANDTTVIRDTTEIVLIDSKTEYDTTTVVYNDTIYLHITKTNYVDRIRTVMQTNTVVDTRLINQLRDSVDKYKTRYIDKDAELSAAKSKSKKKTWLLSILALSTLFLAYIKFFK